MISALNRILTRIASSWPGSSKGGSSIRICLPLSLSVHTLSGSISSGIAFSPHIPSLRRASQNDAARLCSSGDTGPTRLPGRSAAFARRIQEPPGKNCASAEVGHGGRRQWAGGSFLSFPGIGLAIMTPPSRCSATCPRRIGRGTTAPWSGKKTAEQLRRLAFGCCCNPTNSLPGVGRVRSSRTPKPAPPSSLKRRAHCCGRRHPPNTCSQRKRKACQA